LSRLPPGIATVSAATVLNIQRPMSLAIGTLRVTIIPRVTVTQFLLGGVCRSRAFRLRKYGSGE
jgi:hypothetical protein